MLSRLSLVSCLAPIVSAVALVATLPDAAQVGATITTGSVLPRIEGETLSAKRIVLPESVKGRIGLLVFSFSREAGDAARCWNETYARIRIPDADATALGIMMLGDVPWLIRGLVVGGIKKGIPAAAHDRTVKVFADDDAWRTGLGVQAAGSPYLVLVDRTGRIRWLYSATCDGTGEQRLREQLRGLLAEKATADDRSPRPDSVR